MRKLVAVIACRNKGSRLYGKPLQNLNIDNGWTILDQIIFSLSNINCIDELVLAVSEGVENDIYEEYASAKNLNCIRGDQVDVLGRLIKGLDYVNGTDLFRVTSESPFPLLSGVNNDWLKHKKFNFDASFLDDIIDGCGFEIISREALKTSWDKGNSKHRSELCSLYIRENKKNFKINQIEANDKLKRKDIRLTVDYPEDLVVCREIYNKFVKNNNDFDLLDLIKYIDEQSRLKSLISPYCDEGYKSMYL